MNNIPGLRWIQRMIGALGLLLLVAACTANPEPPAAGAADETTPTPATVVVDKLDGTQWLLVEWGPAGALTPLVEGTTVTLALNQGEAGGSSGCNGYGATYSVDGNRITFDTSGFMTTQIACEPAIMEQEQGYLEALQAAESFTLLDDRLTIHTPGVDLVYQMQVLTEQVLMEDMVWYLTSFVTGETAQSVSAGSEVTLTLSAGRATGHGGCNQYFTDYQLAEGQLRFGPVGATKKACVEGIMSQESAYFNALANVTGYTLTSDTLTLNHPDGQLVFTARRPLPSDS